MTSLLTHTRRPLRARREHDAVATRLAQSGCQPEKTLAHFDFAAAPGVNRTLIQELATCQLIGRHENVLLCGPSGVGNSHLANALACEALKRDCRVLARPTHRLVNELHAARANGPYPRHLARILNVDLLVLDDLGLQPLSVQAGQDLYEIIRGQSYRQRNRRKTTAPYQPRAPKCPPSHRNASPPSPGGTHHGGHGWYTPADHGWNNAGGDWHADIWRAASQACAACPPAYLECHRRQTSLLLPSTPLDVRWRLLPLDMPVRRARR